jgi:Ca2+-binding EF-hand superfamily protein
MDSEQKLERTLLFKEFASHVMPVDFVNRTGYGGVPGYTKPPDLKQRRRARDLSQTNMRKAAGHKTFEQLEEILRSKIMEKTKSGGLVLFRMFRKFDTNKDGVIDFDEFNVGMRKWNMNLDQEELRQLFDRYDKNGKGNISYYEFIKHLLPDDFVSIDDMKGLGGLPGQSKFDRSKAVLQKAAKRAEQNSRMSHLGLGSHSDIEAMLRDKINGKTKAGGSMLFRTFRKFDVNKDGVIDFPEFKNIMTKWNLNLDDKTLKQLFKRYDKEGNNHIKYYEFLRHLLPSDFPDEKSFLESMANYGGRSSPLPSSPFTKEKKSAYELAAIRRLHNSASGMKGLDSFSHLEQILREKINGKTKAGGASLFRTFRKFDTNKDGVIDFEEFKTIMHMWNLNMDDKTLWKMFHRYDKEQNGHIKYYEFIKHLLPDDFISKEKMQKMGGMPGGVADRNQRKISQRKAASRIARSAMISSQTISLDALEDILRQKIMQKTKGGPRELYLAFQKFDDDASGDIAFDEFNRVVKIHFNLELSSLRMRQLYERFIPELKSDSKNIRRIDNVANLPIKATVPLSSRDKVIVTSRNHRLTNNAKHRKIAEHAVGKKIIALVQNKYKEILKKLNEVNRHSTGLVTRAELRFIICQMGVKCNDSDCLEIARLSDCNRRGSIEYKALLDILNLRINSSRIDHTLKRPGSAKYLPLNTSRTARHAQSSDSIAMTLHSTLHAPPAKELEVIRKKLNKSWKQILGRLKGQDTRRKGVLSPNTFRKVLTRFNIHLSDHMMRHFKTLFACKKSKRKGISYTAFIRYFTVEHGNTTFKRPAKYIPRQVSMSRAKSMPILSRNPRNKNISKVKRRLVQEIGRQVKQLTSANPNPFNERKLLSSSQQSSLHKRVKKSNTLRSLGSLATIPININAAQNSSNNSHSGEMSSSRSYQAYPSMVVQADALFDPASSLQLNHSDQSRLVCKTLKSRMMQMWKPIRLELRRFDPKRKGYISGRKFREILARYGISMTENDFFSILEVFEKKPRTSGQKINYDLFIKECIA